MTSEPRYLPRPRHTALAGVLLALALLLAQTGAVVHACSHLKSSAEVLSTAGAGFGACQACCSFAPMLAAASGKHHSSNDLPTPAGALRTPAADPLVALSPRHAFLSRAPPSLG